MLKSTEFSIFEISPLNPLYIVRTLFHSLTIEWNLNKNRLKRRRFAILSAFSIGNISQNATLRKIWHYLRDERNFPLSKYMKFAGDDRGRFFKNDFEVWQKINYLKLLLNDFGLMRLKTTDAVFKLCYNVCLLYSLMTLINPSRMHHWISLLMMLLYLLPVTI